MYQISWLCKLCLHLILVCGTSKIYALGNSVQVNKTVQKYNDQNDYLLEKRLKLAFKNHLVKENEDENIPTNALNGIYTECVFELSFPCLQKKLIGFLYELDKMKNINLIGNTVSLVRKNEVASDTTMLAKEADHLDQAYLENVIDNLIDKFFDNHSLRVRLPEYFVDSTGRNTQETYLDIDFGSSHVTNTLREGRKRKHGHRHGHDGHGHGGHGHGGHGHGGHGHGGHGHGGHGHGGHGHGGHGHGGHDDDDHGGHKGIKKMMMMIGLMTCMKLTMMGPMMVGLIGLKAMKALILAVISLTISKMMMLGKVDIHSLLSTHGWQTAGGSGWDRNIQEASITSTLPYNLEPPVSYNGYINTYNQVY